MQLKTLVRSLRMFYPALIRVANGLNYGNPSHLFKLKNCLLRLTGLKIEGSALISAGFECLYPNNITLQDKVALGHNNRIWAFDRVTVGLYTQTARDLLIIAGTHDVASFKPLGNQQVVIGQGCWIGARVTILGGVTIGKGCIIGAGAVVNKSIPDWSIAVGVPARIVRKRIPADEIISPFGSYSPEDLRDII